MVRAAQCLKKNKADKLNDDEVDDYDWTCQGCLVRPFELCLCLGFGLICIGPKAKWVVALLCKQHAALHCTAFW